jgi:uncharacterized LabA/DUF88 family protein
VAAGDARRRRKVGLQHKKADVMIAVDMLTHPFRHNMHQTTLLTGDNDFKPLIDFRPLIAQHLGCNSK